MSKHKIILAEPSQLLRTVLMERLQQEEFSVTPVENGLKLLDAINQDSYDLIIAEELLPFKSGFEIIETARNEGIPVLIISDADLEEKILTAFRLGASDFIDKPFSPNEVVARAKNILSRLS